MAYKQQVRDQQDMKLHNRALIWDLIFTARPVSRAQLAKITAMSPTSITRIVGELMDFGLLVEMPTTHVGVGRKATMLELNRDAFFTVGVDVDVDSVQTCLLDVDNRPRSFLERKMKGKQPSAAAIAEMSHGMYLEMLATTGVEAERVKAVGVSVSGVVDREKGMVVMSPQLHWRNEVLRAAWEERFGLPASFENDVKAAVYEEYVRHKECRADTVAYLTIGSGIGSALMYNGQVLRGGNNAAGEVGHITVRHDDGDMCDCGRRGCLYSCLSEKALLKRIRQLSDRPPSIERWVREYREGAEWALRMTDEAAGYLATAINHTLCSYDPAITIVGGKLLYAMPELLELALDRKGYIYEALQSHVRIIPSITQKQDSVIGAAIIAKTAYLEQLLHERN